VNPAVILINYWCKSSIISRSYEDSSTRLKTQMWILPIVHFKQNSSKQICRRWLSQQSSLLLCKSPVIFWRPLILKRSAWCKRGWRRIPSDSGSGFPYILKSYNLYRWKWSNLHNWFHKNLSPSRRSNRQGTCQSNAPKVLNEGVLDVTDQGVLSPHQPSSLGSPIDTLGETTSLLKRN